MLTTILVVDDRAINREFLVILLEYAGYRVLEAAEGAEALDIVRHEQVGLIISDILMPVMDGIEFANRLHAEPAIAHIPIIFYTATYRATEARTMAQRCGVAVVLGKPAEPKTILAAVATALGNTQAIETGKGDAKPSKSFLSGLVALQYRLQAAFIASDSSVEVIPDRALYASGNSQALSLRTAALLELSMALPLEHEPQLLLELFCRAAQDIMNAKYTAVGMGGSGQSRRSAQRGMADVEVATIFSSLDPDTGVLYPTLFSGDLLRLPSKARLVAIDNLPALHPLQKSALLVPIVQGSHPYGWLYVADKLGADGFNEEDEQFAAMLVAQLAPTYENMVLYDEVRQHAGELEREIAEHRRTNEALQSSETRFRQLAENIKEVFFLINQDNTHMLYVSPAYEDIWGRSCESLYAMPLSWLDCIHPDDKEQTLKDYADRDTKGRFDFEYRIIRPDGQRRLIRMRGFPILNDAGGIFRFAGIAEDITEKAAQTRRIARLSGLYSVLSGINSAIVRIHDRHALFQEACRVAVTHGAFNMTWIGVIDPDTCEGNVVAWAGAEAGDIENIGLGVGVGADAMECGLPACVAVREKHPVICSNVQTDSALASCRAALLARGHYAVAAWPLMIDNRAVAVIAFFAPEVDFFDDERIKLLNELAGDLSFGLQFIDKKEKESRLAARLTTTLESITDAFIMVDRQWNLTYLNSDAERLLHCPKSEVLGMNLWERFPEAVGGRYYQEYHRAVEQNCSVSFEEYYEPFNLWTEIRAYPSEEGLAIYFLDISARKAAEAEIHELAFFDKLTALPNRKLLQDRLEHAMAICKRSGRPGAVLFIDLDNFKTINDTHGHDIGDLLLQQVADRLTAAVRATDTVARLGGDEYVILLENLGGTEDEVAINAKMIAKLVLDSFKEPFEIAGLKQYSTCSIGVALFDGQEVAFDDVLKRADLAMYQAKGSGRNAMSFFSSEMQARIINRVALETDLRQALAEQQFILYYQPQTHMDGSMTGVEALVRWASPTRGLVLPADFIPVAEDAGLIAQLGGWVMKTACELLSTWSKSTQTEMLTMAVNISAHQFHSADFIEQVLKVLEATGANPYRLTLELTENLLINDIPGTIQKMNVLKNAGIRFALDDFGIGYSSLAYLHHLPLDQLKIDQSFIQDTLTGGHGAVITRTILALGSALNLTVVAEGVETQEQRAFIEKEGCEEYQGYLFCQPLPEAALEKFILNTTDNSGIVLRMRVDGAHRR